jgi:hypothetical protein
MFGLGRQIWATLGPSASERPERPAKAKANRAAAEDDSLLEEAVGQVFANDGDAAR